MTRKSSSRVSTSWVSIYSATIVSLTFPVVATKSSCPKMSSPKLPAQLAVTQSMMRLFHLASLARRQSRRHIQQQMHMIGSHMPLHDLDIQRSANLSRQVPHLFPDLSSRAGLRYLVMNTKDISADTLHANFSDTQTPPQCTPKPPEASPKGEGVHPSQSGTLRGPPNSPRQNENESQHN